MSGTMIGVFIACTLSVSMVSTELTPLSPNPAIDPATANGREPRTLVPLGTSGAKQLYAETTSTFTWFGAKSYCTSQTTPAGLKLASVLAADFTYLTTTPAAVTTLGKGKIYWTGGRDAQTWAQFVWDNPADTATAIVPGGNQPFYNVGYRTCVAFMIMADGSDGRLAGLDCTNQYPVLCQTP